MTFEELMKWLYKAGTGWLGWNPDIVRAAHMQEIILAYEGKTEQLKAVYGVNDKKENAGMKRTKAHDASSFDKMFG